MRQVFIDSQYQYNKRVLSDNRKWLTIDVIEVCILKIESILCGDSMSHVTHTSNIRKAYKKGTCEKGIIYFILLLRKPNMIISKLWFFKLPLLLRIWYSKISSFEIHESENLINKLKMYKNSSCLLIKVKIRIIWWVKLYTVISNSFVLLSYSKIPRS